MIQNILWEISYLLTEVEEICVVQWHHWKGSHVEELVGQEECGLRHSKLCMEQ